MKADGFVSDANILNLFAKFSGEKNAGQSQLPGFFTVFVICLRITKILLKLIFHYLCHVVGAAVYLSRKNKKTQKLYKSEDEAQNRNRQNGKTELRESRNRRIYI